MSEIREMPVLVLFPHNRCNCRCVMCDIWKIRQSRQITPNDLRPHLESIRELKVKWVVFSGGEAQLNADLPELAAILREQGIRTTLLTAGLLLEAHASKLVTYIDDVIVSLDGPPAIHDATRNVPSAFAKLERGIGSLRQLRADFPISARTTIQKNNFHCLRETVATAKMLRLDSISFLAADLTSEAFNREQRWSEDRQTEIGLDREELRAFADQIEMLISENAADIASGFIREDAPKLRRLVSHFAAHLGLTEAQAPRCNAPWASAVIEADGAVRPCFFQPVIGNIHETSLLKIVNGPGARQFRENLDVARDPICLRCVCSLYVPAESGVSTTPEPTLAAR